MKNISSHLLDGKVEALKTHMKRAHDGFAQQVSQRVETSTFEKKFSSLDEGVSNQEQALQRVADLLNQVKNTSSGEEYYLR